MLTPPPRLAALICLCFAAGVAVAAAARTGRFEVVGLSMAPGLLPGDVVTTDRLAAVARGRGPDRFERWIVAAADGTAAIKRVVGLPGETVSIREGDLAVDGRVVVTPPPILSQTASVVLGAGGSDRGGPHDGPCRRSIQRATVLDDAAFAPHERRILLPVRDGGVAAMIRVQPGAAQQPRLRVRVGTIAIGWRLPSAGRFAVVAGRLDRHAVACCWRCNDRTERRSRRGVLPDGAPDDWQLIRPWPVVDGKADDDAPEFDLRIDGDEGCDPAVGVIEDVVVWRDLLHRPAADGRDEWRLETDQFFVLGDFPSGSRDSRHWGPLPRRDLRFPVSPNP